MEKTFLECVSKLDAMVGSKGELSILAHKIVKEEDESASVEMLQKMVQISRNKESYSENVLKMTQFARDSLYRYVGFLRVACLYTTSRSFKEYNSNKTYEDLLQELNGLVGLRTVKECVSNLIAYNTVQILREDVGLKKAVRTLHMAFTGNPGTGKTTVARIIGRIYKHIGLLSKGHFVEVSRTDLIAGYQGQTALKVKKVIEKAKGGVLFIDEAYSITENEHSDSYGRECLTELTKALEDYRDDLVVIVAGYTDPMKKFFESNPGLKSRFNTFIEFDDYSPNELGQILQSMCKNNDYLLDEEVKEKIHLYFKQQTTAKDENFANGRLVRNIYDNLVMNHARRVINMISPKREDLSLIKAEDFIS